ncbi:MAG: hypothetical protein LW710_03400 [Burkholderiales bacterium]|jgi:HD-GYP domain-containing protein (c-di-GMP phosphodiesterase class II)|uniref:HD-GYP domain-containing protein n=1 Tax=Limnobacter sp. TaxID=2003368 RepID=UPI0039BC2F9E|nr:hypothetical protein [Burkholderiales bacterium]
MVMHRLLAQQIRQYEPLPWDVYDSSHTLLLRKGFLIDKHIHLPTLIERGIYVELGSVKEKLIENSPQKNRLDPWQLWEDILARLGQLLKNPPQNGEFPQQIEELADLVRLLGDKSTDVALAAIMLMDEGRYPVVHSLHCAILADLVAKRLEWDLQERRSLCCAALTMNIAMLDLQQTLYHQSEPPKPEQQLDITLHPEQGVRMLYALGVRDTSWLQTVMEHHEKPDGKGYPKSLQSPKPSALLLRTVDIYCAKVSPRAYRKPMLASEASRLVFTSEGHNENNPFPGCLIKQVGIYPPGSFVKLLNGEIGVVFKRGENANKPLVYSLLNDAGQCITPPIKRDTSLPGLKIQAVMPKDTVMLKFDPRTIWKPNFHY